MLFTQETLVLLSVFIITSLLTRTESQATTELGQNAMPNSIVFHSNIASSATEIDEDDQRTFFFNYTFTPPSTSTPAGGYKLLVCAWMEDSDIASVNFRSRPFSLDENPSDDFNMTVRGGFIGRTYLHVVYRLTAAASPGSYNLTFSCPQQVVNLVTFANNQLNLTDVFLQNGQTTEAIFGSSHEFVAVRVERLIDKAFMVVVIILVFIVNLGLGCKTDMDKIKSTLRRPIAPIVGVCSQFILMPLISFGAIKAFDFDPALALGFFALGCSPGGSASNAYTLLLDGDVTLSITMTFISTLAALGMIPLWLFTLGKQLYSHTSIKIPYQNIFISLISLVIAVVIGLVIKHFRPRWAKVMVKVSKGLMVVFLIFVMTIGVYANLYIFRLMSITVLLAAALLPYLGFILGGFVAFLFRFPRHQVLTVAIETGIQNTGIAIVLLLVSLPHPDSDRSIVAPVASALFTPLPLWVAIAAIRIRRRFCKKGDDHDHEELSQIDHDHHEGNGDNNGGISVVGDREVHTDEEGVVNGVDKLKSNNTSSTFID